MRHLSHNRRSHRREAQVRRGLVLFVAFMLLVTGLPFALAGDDVAVDETQSDATAAEGTAEATEDPIVIPVDPPSEPTATEAPADPVDEPADDPVDEPADEGGDSTTPDTVDESSGEADADADSGPTRQLAPATTDESGAQLQAVAEDRAGNPSLLHNVKPTVIDGNPTCGGLFPNEIKVEPVRSGTYTATFTNPDGSTFTATVTVTVPGTPNGDGQTFNFSSADPEVGAVVVKGGSNANLYTYPTGVSADSGLHAPVNPSNGSYYGLSHISFCFPPFGIPDLELSKKAVNAASTTAATVTQVAPGGSYFYQLTISNIGTGPTGPVTLTETLPSQLTADWANATSDPAGVVSCSAATATCTVGSIAADDEVIVWIPVTVKAGECAVAQNSASVTDGDTSDSATSPPIMVNCRPDLTVAKSSSASEVVPGEQFTYTITASNSSTATEAATDVIVTDDLDDDLADVAASVSVAGGAARPCADPGSGNTISCEVGDLAIGQSAVVTVTARATVAACGPVDNQAFAEGSNFDQKSSDEVTVMVLCAPDVDIVKSSSDDEVVPGEVFTYTITATNASTATAAATGVTITDNNLDASLTGVTATVVVGTGTAEQCTIGAGNAVSCDVGTLAIGESATVTISVTPTMASCPLVTNRASVSGSNFPTDQSDTVDVTVTCTPGLTIVKTASETSVVPGESWNYEITVSNPASSTATSEDVVVIDDLHDGLDVAQPTFSVEGGPAQQCAMVALFNVIRCDGFDLAPGESAVITVVATATPASCGPIVNLAQASATNITNPVSDTVTVDVVCTPAIVVDKTASAGTVNSGEDITYTITASNPTGSATAAAEDVVITDTLDAGLLISAATITSNGVTDDCVRRSDNFVSCEAGDIAVGGTAIVTITATTTPVACGVVTNVSSADGTNFTTELSDEVDVTVVCPPDIDIVKSASSDRVDVGDNYTYTITATNNALATGSAAKDVVITDDLDDDLAGVSATYQVDGGTVEDCDPTGAGNLVRCAIGDLAIGSSVDVTVAVTATVEACPSVANVSTVAGTNFEPESSDEVNVLIPCAGPVSSISLVKTGVAPSDGPGDLITYTYLITNTGETTLTAITLDDDVLGSITVPKTTLLAGESMTATATHEITLADIERGDVVNVAETIGTTPTGGTVRDEDTETIPLDGDPSILLEKTADREFGEVGETVTYTYVITNTGTVRLTDITLVDDKIGTIVAVDDGLSLAPGESTSVEADYTLTEADLASGDDVTNVAVTSGLPPKGPPVTSTDRVTVGIIEVLVPGTLRVVKAVNGDGEPAPGAEFGFNVDCGDVALGRGRNNFTLPADGGTHDIGVQIPDGTQCTVTETRDAGADATTVAVDSGAAQAGTSTRVTIVEDEARTVTFVNTFGDRPIVPPEPPPEDPDLPATGANLALQLALGIGLLTMGTGMVRLFGSTTTGRGRRGARPTTWTTTL